MEFESCVDAAGESCVDAVDVAGESLNEDICNCH